MRIFLWIGMALIISQTIHAQMDLPHVYKKQNLCGLVGSDSTIIFEPQFNFIGDFYTYKSEYVLFREEASRGIGNDIFGIISAQGKIVLSDLKNKPEIRWKYAYWYENTDQLLGLKVYDLENEKIIIQHDSLRFEKVVNSAKPVFVLRDKRNLYYYNAQGKLMVESDFGWSLIATDKECPIFKTYTKKSADSPSRELYFDCNGKILETSSLPDKNQILKNNDLILDQDFARYEQSYNYDKIESFSVNEIGQEKLNYLKDNFSEKLITKVFMQSGKAAVLVYNKNNKYSLYDTKGNEILPFEFNQVEIERNWLLVNKGAKKGLYTIDGKEIFSTNYFRIECVSSHLSPYDFRISTYSGYIGYATIDGEIYLPSQAFEK